LAVVAARIASTVHPGDSVERVMASWAATRPGLEVSPVAIIARVLRLGAELQPRLDAVLGRYGVRSADFAVLATLVRLGEARLSQSRLGGELGLTAGTISVRLDRLERARLIARERGSDDQREMLVALTKKGRALFEACVDDHLANSRELVAALDAKERELLAGLLGKLLASLERRPARRDPRRVAASKPDRTQEVTHARGNRRGGQDRRQRRDPARKVGS
jgi:DNA-binding MarR family transcriptional regulator